MAIISRISRLLVSDLHALLERLEEPGLVLKQAIRDMEESLQAQKLQAQRGQTQLRRLERRGEELASRLLALDEQLDASIAAGRMDTARSTLRRKLQCDAQMALIKRQGAELEDQVVQLRDGIERRDVQLQGLREKAQLLCEVEDREPDDGIASDDGTWVNDQDVEAALIRELERRRAS